MAPLSKDAWGSAIGVKYAPEATKAAVAKNSKPTWDGHYGQAERQDLDTSVLVEEETIATLADLFKEAAIEEVPLDGLTLADMAEAIKPKTAEKPEVARSAVLSLLKKAGVAKMTDRQKLANTLGRVKREKRLKPSDALSEGVEVRPAPAGAWVPRESPEERAAKQEAAEDQRRREFRERQEAAGGGASSS